MYHGTSTLTSIRPARYEHREFTYVWEQAHCHVTLKLSTSACEGGLEDWDAEIVDMVQFDEQGEVTADGLDAFSKADIDAMLDAFNDLMGDIYSGVRDDVTRLANGW